MAFENFIPGLKLFNGSKPKARVIFSPKKPNTLRVVTLNAHFGRNINKIGKAFFDNPNLAVADVVLLQEIEHRFNEVSARSQQLAKLLGFYHVYFPSRNLDWRFGTHGLAILSRFPLKRAKAIKLPVYKLLQLRPRLALSAQVTVGEKTVTIYNVHLNGPLNYNKRIEQLQEVIDQINVEKPNQPVIMGGDFNTIPLITLAGTMIPLFYFDQKKKFHVFLRKQGFETRCEQAGYTMKRGFVKFQLDGIYPKNGKVVQFAVERSVKVSDHMPLWADVKI